MSVTTRLVMFALALVVAFAVGAGLGAAFGPEPAARAPMAPMEH